MWSFCRFGGSGTEQPSSDAMAARGALQVSHSPLSFPGRLKPFFSFSAEKEKNGFKNVGRWGHQPLQAPLRRCAPAPPEGGAKAGDHWSPLRSPPEV